MRQWPILLFLAVPLVSGCATGEPFQPFPARNADGQVGLVRNLGTTQLNLWVKDEAGRDIEVWYLAPAVRPISPLDINQHRSPITVRKSLPPGTYRVEYIPFFRWWGVLSGWQRVDLPRGTVSFTVGRDPLAVYDRRTGRHWGWVLEIHGGDAPRDFDGTVNFNLRCC